MLAKENADLMEEIAEVQREVEKTNREREEQRRRFEGVIRTKDDIVNQFNYNNDLLRQEIREMRSCLRLEQLEAELNSIKASNAREEKNKGAKERGRSHRPPKPPPLQLRWRSSGARPWSRPWGSL